MVVMALELVACAFRPKERLRRKAKPSLDA